MGGRAGDVFAVVDRRILGTRASACSVEAQRAENKLTARASVMDKRSADAFWNISLGSKKGTSTAKENSTAVAVPVLRLQRLPIWEVTNAIGVVGNRYAFSVAPDGLSGCGRLQWTARSLYTYIFMIVIHRNLPS